MERTRDLRRAGFLGLMIGIALGVVIIALALSKITTPVEAQSPQRLQFQNETGFENQWSGSIQTYCDTATGNLLYVYTYNGGLAVVPNGCTKNLR